MDVAVVGAGLMGSVIAGDLALASRVNRVVVVDSDRKRLKLVSGKSRKIRAVHSDVKERAKLSRILGDADAAVVALPHGVSVPVDKLSLEAGTDTLDLAFEDSQLKLDALARRRGAVLIPGCGLAPGLSNVLVVNGSRYFDDPQEGHIWVGGIPQRPEPPLGYRLVFSIKGLLNEYLSRPRVLRDGRPVSLEPFSDVEEVVFPEPIGRCEAFFTDGLATLLYTKRRFKHLDERTVRWPGHADKIRFMIQAGFFDERPVRVNGEGVSPLDVSSELLVRLLTKGDGRDVTVMRVDASGLKDGKRATVRYELLDYYDARNRVTSMGRTTGFTCSIFSQMLGSGRISAKGVVPPEEALDGPGVGALLGELSRRGVLVRESVLRP